MVLCSSVGALVTVDKCFGDDIDGVTYTAESRVPNSHYEPIKQNEHYCAGKALSLNWTDEFVKTPQAFDVINIFPSSVIGRCELSRTPEELVSSSNIRGLAVAIGKEIRPMPTSCIHVDDLAKMHVDVLRMDTKKYHNFGAGVQMSFSDSKEIIRAHFPQAVDSGIFPMTGNVPDRPFLFDTSATENFFGWKFNQFEDMVRDAAEQYLELVETTKPASSAEHE